MMNYYNYMILNLVGLFMMIILVLVGVAFLTLLERKILGYVQLRKGPNKVGILGIFQPFSDAIKLFNKEFLFIFKSNYYLFYMSPIFMFFFMLMMWLMVPYITNIYYMNYSLLLIFVVMTLMGYMVILMGWSSNSLYSLVGSVRVIAQMLSYEVSFIMIILILMILGESYSFLDFLEWQKYFWFMVILWPVFIVFFISILAELNRSPMDFVEGESELVSGFNIEYFSGGFALIFMAEYGMIIFFSYMVLVLFTNLMYFWLYMYVFLNLMISLIILMRGLLPRMRYDELMYLCWKIILPLVLNYMVVILSFKLVFVFMF
uniref:NADH-ubiquinone oxidoreductase chain 1 n=1 Tax=Meranoplus bicolor TaxID=611886 RepID=A0A8K1RDQ8_9HYME|nr:NADH dehydrogenase subunit 1 [Meranoplus bicolor]